MAIVRGIHRRPVNSPHKGPVKRKMFPFDDVIMHKNNYSGTLQLIQITAIALKVANRSKPAVAVTWTSPIETKVTEASTKYSRLPI